MKTITYNFNKKLYFECFIAKQLKKFLEPEIYNNSQNWPILLINLYVNYSTN